jgi:nuclear pore complex protein Nup62
LSSDQDQLEQDLNFVYSQQNDLEKAIKSLESGIEQMPIMQQQMGDTSRIEMYKSLIEVDSQLKSMSCDLKDIIKRLNDTNVNMNDPIAQISKILNAHMNSLNWIEENTGKTLSSYQID